MEVQRRRFLQIAAGVVALPAIARVVRAQSYPIRPVRLLVGFAAGGPNDIVARLVGERLSAVWAKPVVIDNVTGSGGNLAADRTAKSAPDGHTLLMTAAAQIVINPSLYQSISFDPIKDFTPISLVSSFSNILAVHHDVPAKSVHDLVTIARSQPGRLTFASGGIGTSQHLGVELLKSMAGVDIRHVPYRSLALAVPDLLAGRVTMAFLSTTYLELMREGKLRALAVSSLKRSQTAPDLPTMVESGFPGFDANGWFGLVAPAGTSPAIIDKIQGDTASILMMSDLRRKFDELGLEPVGNTPSEFADSIKSEISKWATVIGEAGIGKIE